MAKDKISRRHFFIGSLLAGAIPTGGWGSVPSLRTLGYKSPNEKLNIACIGAGGQARADIGGVSGENLVAFADPDSVRAADTFNEHPNAPKYTDFRRMFDKEEKNIDAVTIAIPDHMHATAAMWAMERGKHVYVEKPLTRTPWEARMLSEAAVRYSVATQMGNQGYSNDGARVAAEIIWSGEIGNVTEVHAWTNRPIWPQGISEIPGEEKVPNTLDWDTWIGVAEMRPYTSGGDAYRQAHHTQSGFYLPFNWRGFLDFGCGPIGDMACHILGAPNMALLLGNPTSVEMIKQDGKNSLMYPNSTVTRFEFPSRGDLAPLTLYWYDAQKSAAYRPKDLPEGEPLIGGADAFGAPVPRNPYSAAARGATPVAPAGAIAPSIAGRGGAGGVVGEANGAVFVGDKGYLTTDTYGAKVRLLPEERHKSYTLPGEVLTRSPEHHLDWIRACKGGDKACSDFSVAGPFTEWILLATIAMRVEGRLEWDSAKLRFTNNEEANRYVTPDFRKSWSQVWAGKKLNKA
jgi:Oxidoreductase family, NAD-binding Rossmann fold